MRRRGRQQNCRQERPLAPVVYLLLAALTVFTFHLISKYVGETFFWKQKQETPSTSPTAPEATPPRVSSVHSRDAEADLPRHRRSSPHDWKGDDNRYEQIEQDTKEVASFSVDKNAPSYNVRLSKGKSAEIALAKMKEPPDSTVIIGGILNNGQITTSTPPDKQQVIVSSTTNDDQYDHKQVGALTQNKAFSEIPTVTKIANANDKKVRSNLFGNPRDRQVLKELSSSIVDDAQFSTDDVNMSPEGTEEEFLDLKHGQFQPVFQRSTEEIGEKENEEIPVALYKKDNLRDKIQPSSKDEGLQSIHASAHTFDYIDELLTHAAKKSEAHGLPGTDAFYETMPCVVEDDNTLKNHPSKRSTYVREMVDNQHSKNLKESTKSNANQTPASSGRPKSRYPREVGNLLVEESSGEQPTTLLTTPGPQNSTAGKLFSGASTEGSKAEDVTQMLHSTGQPNAIASTVESTESSTAITTIGTLVNSSQYTAMSTTATTHAPGNTHRWLNVSPYWSVQYNVEKWRDRAWKALDGNPSAVWLVSHTVPLVVDFGSPHELLQIRITYKENQHAVTGYNIYVTNGPHAQRKQVQWTHVLSTPRQNISAGEDETIDGFSGIGRSWKLVFLHNISAWERWCSGTYNYRNRVLVQKVDFFGSKGKPTLSFTHSFKTHASNTQAGKDPLFFRFNEGGQHRHFDESDLGQGPDFCS
ncbi:uncharacterized protein LOC118432783 [Branchiostoma floridae]|uniref:Uncharacterized protein LOC118432783 n=1 Tax=Branchiostoma floridae TaxID=7739 RepID=A0A9J7NDT1_BRAFL|nr:uncharacterized protein LOC118432783 [Branchiostoma floridae]